MGIRRGIYGNGDGAFQGEGDPEGIFLRNLKRVRGEFPIERHRAPRMLALVLGNCIPCPRHRRLSFLDSQLSQGRTCSRSSQPPARTANTRLRRKYGRCPGRGHLRLMQFRPSPRMPRHGGACFRCFAAGSRRRDAAFRCGQHFPTLTPWHVDVSARAVSRRRRDSGAPPIMSGAERRHGGTGEAEGSVLHVDGRTFVMRQDCLDGSNPQ